MTGASITIVKQDEHGRDVLPWAAEVVSRGPDFVCIRAPFTKDVADLGFVVFRAGDVFVEWYYAARWYNVFRVQDRDTGALKGWYCNISRPAQLGDDVVRWQDLRLDVFVLPNGAAHVLDVDEFDALALPPDDHAAALHAVGELLLLAARREGPFELQGER